MNDQDLDTILALVDGRLTGPEGDAARTRIEADPVLREELAVQMSIASSLRALEPVAMTPVESDQLHSALTDELRLAPPVVTAPARQQPNRWWAPLVAMAGAAAVIVGLFIILPGGSSDETVEDVALSGTTVQATSGADAPASEAGDTTTTAAAAAELEEAPTEAAADASGATDGAGPETLSLPPSLPSAADILAAVQDAEASLDDLGTSGGRLSTQAAEALADCSDELVSLSDGRPVVLLSPEAAADDHAAIAFPETASAPLTVAVVDLATCAIVDTAAGS